jgi:hypothetical protein
MRRLTVYIMSMVEHGVSTPNSARANFTGILKNQLHLSDDEIEKALGRVAELHMSGTLGELAALRAAQDIVSRDWSFPSRSEE